MEQHRHHRRAFFVIPLVLFGAGLAQYHGIYGLKVRRVRSQAEVNGIAVKLAVGRGAQMVFHIP